MALSYPINTPTTIGIESIELRASNVVATSQSPFTYKQQVISHSGQRWEASVRIPSVRKDLAAAWKAFLVSLKGKEGTFLLGDPDYASPMGTATSATVSGSTGDDSVSVTMTGTLLAGDYIQLGSGPSAKLHTILQDQDGDGTLEIWPALRDDYSSVSAVLSNPKGVFRLAQNTNSWNINNSGFYSISFEAVEVIT